MMMMMIVLSLVVFFNQYNKRTRWWCPLSCIPNVNTASLYGASCKCV